MNTISHPRLRELLHYDPNTGVFTRRTDNKRGCRVGDISGSVNQDGYNYLMTDRRTYASHRLAWFYVYGVWPSYDIDHINGDKLDNRINNLRDAPTQINMQNERRPRKNNKAGLMGVHFRKDRNKWVAAVRVAGKSIRCGAFDNPEDAHKAYLEMKRKHHPGFNL